MHFVVLCDVPIMKCTFAYHRSYVHDSFNFHVAHLHVHIWVSVLTWPYPHLPLSLLSLTFECICSFVTCYQLLLNLKLSLNYNTNHYTTIVYKFVFKSSSNHFRGRKKNFFLFWLIICFSNFENQQSKQVFLFFCFLFF